MSSMGMNLTRMMDSTWLVFLYFVAVVVVVVFLFRFRFLFLFLFPFLSAVVVMMV